MEFCCKFLRENLPDGCSALEPDGGYFIWIELPENVIATEFNVYALEKFKVVTIPGDTFSVEKRFKNFLRISIGFQNISVLEPGLKNLCEALGFYLTRK